MDEPLSAIDARLRKNLQIEIRRIQQELNITTIFVTHDQDEAMLMSDRICLLNEGKIEQVSTPIELYTKPKTRFAASFIGHYNVLSPDEFLQAFHTAPTDNKMTAIRPETIQISTEKPGENDLTHTLHGRIINNRSVGNTLHYHIDVNGITFKVDTLFRSFALYKMTRTYGFPWKSATVWLLKIKEEYLHETCNKNVFRNRLLVQGKSALTRPIPTDV